LSQSHFAIPTPIGVLVGVVSGELPRLVGLGFQELRRDGPVLLPRKALPEVARNLEMQVQAFFSGRRKHFEIAFQLPGTPFQRKVWEALQAVGFGQTVSYGELARVCGSPRAARAVGNVLAANPFALLVPCHRVVLANGSPGEYRWESWRKDWLLDFEAHYREQ